MAKSKRVTKPIYFNPDDSRELEILVWAEDKCKFSSFGGLVKDLLYREMKKEQGLIETVSIQKVLDKPIEPTTDNDEPKKDNLKDTLSDFISTDDVDAYDC